MQRFGFEERFDGHLAIHKLQEVFDLRLKEKAALWEKASNYNLPEDVVFRWESREDTELTAWPNDVERFRSKDRVLKRTWERSHQAIILP